MSKINIKSKNVLKKKKLKLIKKIALISSLGITCLVGGIAVSKRNNSTTNNHLEEINNINDDFNFEKIPVLNFSIIDKFDINKFRSAGYFIGDDDFDYDIKCNLKEFESIMGDNVTWVQVKNTLNSNTNIDDEYKLILNDTFTNLENSNLNMCLSALNYNLSNLKIKRMQYSGNATGEFKLKECCLYICDDIPNDVFKKTLVHEIMHCTQFAYANVNDNKVYCTNQENVITGMDNYIYNIGNFFDEGYTDYLTSLALNEKLDCNNSKWSYSLNFYVLLMSLKMCDMKIEDYANNGYMSIINKLNERNMTITIQNLMNIENNFNFSLDDINDVNRASICINNTYTSLLAIFTEYYCYIHNNYFGLAEKDQVYSLCNCYENYIIPSILESTDGNIKVIKNTGCYGISVNELYEIINSLDDYIEKTY